MEEKVPVVKYEPLRYFLSDSNRDRHHVNDQAAEDADKLLGGKKDSALLIDESGIPEKGKMSVGVSRQWCGQPGKTDNCQAAVFATLGYGRFSTPIDCRLYLPKSRTDDKERCLKAKVPADKIVFQTKHEQALDMVFHVRKNGGNYSAQRKRPLSEEMKKVFPAFYAAAVGRKGFPRKASLIASKMFFEFLRAVEI